ncbi:acetyl-CoA carboxylase biotin carboxylase subunit family protein [Streptomyces sp. NPDC017520]|uniref:acetyl-CoA carboxylase biotin carboxylase subunit family protein n=1 Tax=Streptomyces sp. NPDC017520 TaxID=3364998 RepID=UPI00378B9ECC
MLVVYDTGSFTPYEISAAAEDLCEPVFVLRGENVDPAGTRKLLKGFGKVVELPSVRTGLDVLGALDPQGVITFCDHCVELSAAIAARLGLRFHSPDTATKLADKAAQRAALRAAGLPSPRFAEVTSTAGIDAALATVPLPAVIKPTRGGGSANTYRVEDGERARTLLADCLGALRSSMIIEEILVGAPGAASAGWSDIVSVETLFVAGEAHHLATTGRFPFAPPFRETGSFMPSRLSETRRAEALDLAEVAATALGVVDGFVHTELKLTGDGWGIVEVNGRLGGFVAWLLQRSRGVEVGTLALRAALRLPVDPPPSAGVEMRDAAEIAFRRLLVPPVGAKRLEEAAEIVGVSGRGVIDSVHFRAAPGDSVDWTQGYQAAVAIVSGAVPTHDDLEEVLLTIDSRVRLTFS